MRSRSSLIALTSTCCQNRPMARGVWRFSRSQSSIVMRSRPARRPCSRSIARRPRATAILSSAPRKWSPANEPRKCSGAGSEPERSSDTRPPGSMKRNSRKNRMRSRTPSRSYRLSRFVKQARSTCWQLSMTSEPSAAGRAYEAARPPRKARDSNSSTSKPALPRAAAADSPARPPPAIRTRGMAARARTGGPRFPSAAGRNRPPGSASTRDGTARPPWADRGAARP